MKHRKLIALLIAMALVLSSLAGCGGKTGGNMLGNVLLNFGGTMMKEDDPTKTGFDNEHLVQRRKEMKELVAAGYVEWTWGDVKRVATVAGNCLCVSESVSQMGRSN